jgi:hypothetical protein
MPGVLNNIRFAPVAQRIEQRSSKPKVVGSNPAGGAWMGVKSCDHPQLLETLVIQSPELQCVELFIWEVRDLSCYKDLVSEAGTVRGSQPVVF